MRAIWVGHQKISAPRALREVGQAMKPRRDNLAKTRYTPVIPVSCPFDGICFLLSVQHYIICGNPD